MSCEFLTLLSSYPVQYVSCLLFTLLLQWWPSCHRNYTASILSIVGFFPEEEKGHKTDYSINTSQMREKEPEVTCLSVPRWCLHIRV